MTEKGKEFFKNYLEDEEAHAIKKEEAVERFKTSTLDVRDLVQVIFCLQGYIEKPGHPLTDEYKEYIKQVMRELGFIANVINIDDIEKPGCPLIV